MVSITAGEARQLILDGDAPAGLRVLGVLDLRDTAVTDLPRGLTVSGSLLLNGSAITTLTTLPDDLSVGGSLYLGATAITALPQGLTVGGNLDLEGSAITALPQGLTVGGNLNLEGTAITELPEGLSVGGRLYLGWTAIHLPSAWFGNPHTGQRQRVLATDGEYDLIEREDGSFLAGCRGPWSRKQALAHWGDSARTDRRAKLCVDAILNETSA